jgi:PAS domain S-box-containing protein
MNGGARADGISVLAFTTTAATRRLGDALESADCVTVTAVDGADDPAATLADESGVDCVVCGHDPAEVGRVTAAATERDLPCLVASERPYGSLGSDPLAEGADGFHRVLDDDRQPRLAVHRLQRLVAEREQTAALERAQAYRETLLEDPDRSMGLIDATGTVEYANERALSFAGSFDSDEELVGQPIWETPWIQRSSADEARIREILAKLQAGESVRREIAARDRNHNLIEVETLTRPVLHDGAVIGAVVSAEDVTSHRSRERRLRVVTRVLRHNVRNDLTGILGRLDLLEVPDDEAAADHVAAIRRLVDDIVDKSELARRVQQTLSVDRSPVPSVELSSLLESELTRTRGRFPAVDIERSLPDSCRARAEAGIDIAFRALLENAVEHNDTETPSVSVELRTVTADGEGETSLEGTNRQVEVRIADNGPGIPDHELEPLAADAETDLEHTSGLGLWAADWIVRDSGGTLDFSDNEPRGTVATVTLAAPADDD